MLNQNNVRTSLLKFRLHLLYASKIVCVPVSVNKNTPFAITGFERVNGPCLYFFADSPLLISGAQQSRKISFCFLGLRLFKFHTTKPKVTFRRA